MTTLETVVAMPALDPPPAVARFTGARRAFTWMVIRGAVLQVVTLGIYRFWLTTEMRRFLWANTEIDGDSLDYTGTAIELLLGFLFALAILVPIYVLFFIASLELGIYSQIASIAGVVFLTCFGQYALYRARRYRLTRTVYRGLRFHQDGSAFGYAARAIAWWIAIVLTVGLAYPFAQASLERYKLAHTLYGDLRGAFVQTGTRLFLRGFPIWLLGIGSVAVVIGMSYAVMAMVDWQEAMEVLSQDGLAAADIDQNAALAVVSIALLIGTPIIAFIILYPAFQAVVLKWWLQGIRFGEIAVATRLRKRQIYGVYLRFLLLAIVLGLAIATLVAVVVLGFGKVITDPDTLNSSSSQIGILAASVAFYLVVVMAIWVSWQVAVRLAMWRITVNSVTLTDFAALARVKASGEAASAVGEGLADALGAGGF